MKQDKFNQSSAWKYLSKIVLLTYCDDDGDVVCSTCGCKKHVSDRFMHTGHWIKSTNRSTALEFVNLGPQCYVCNIAGHGLPNVMEQWLIGKHGVDAVDKLRIKKNQIYKLDKYELDRLRIKFKQEFKELVEKRGFNPWK